MASIARNGSPNAPGIRRTSVRASEVAPGGGTSPRTETSRVCGAGGGELEGAVLEGAVFGPAPFGAALFPGALFEVGAWGGASLPVFGAVASTACPPLLRGAGPLGGAAGAGAMNFTWA